MNGDYDINVSCRDIGGNIAEKTTSIKIEIDKTPPEIIRMYRDGTKLKIITNELAECRYSQSSCFFDFENGTLITTGFSQSHLADWDNSIKYHIQCKDIWGNKQNGCTIVIRPSLM
jgi:hypothetical protein